MSITRFRVRSLWSLLPFLSLSRRSFALAVATPGFLEGLVIALDHGLVFWTMTSWKDEQAMRAFRNAGDHLEAMRQTSKLASEMASVSWALDEPRLPDWREAHERLVRDGRFFKLQHATPDHLERRVPMPWTLLSSSAPFKAARR